MMKNIYIILTVLMVCFSGCKVADQEPVSIITANNFYKTAADADNAINGAYDALQSCVQYCGFWGDSRADIFALANTANREVELITGNISPTNTWASWNTFYVGINRVNDLIKNISTIPDNTLANRRDRILGEAYFLRGLFYFYLTRTFEKVPLMLEPYGSGNTEVFPKQAERNEVFAQIEKDLKEAEAKIPDLPFTTAIDNKGRATKAAVRSTLADLYLWQKRYDDAANIADLVIKSPANYALVAGSSYANIFVAKNTSESIFEVQFNYTYQETTLNLLGNSYLPLGGTVTAGGWALKPTQKVIDAYITADSRRLATIQNTGPVPAPYRDKDIIYVNKYQGTLVATQIFHTANFIVYRLPEVILFRAEALNELGRTPEAITLLNQIRVRANVGVTSAVTQADVRLAIENERLLELAYEGKRYFDLVRTGRYAAVTGFTNEAWQRWPIWSEELIRNRNLVQNIGYN